MGNDGSTAGALPVWRQIGAERVFDHFVPDKDIQAANLLRGVREWVRQQGIRHFFDEGRSGIAHTLLPEQGLVVRGDLMVGGDSPSLRGGPLEIFAEAGAAVSTPTGGACFGGHMGILGAGEVCLSTTNRNFVGRMGHPTARVYLANPAVAAASAVKGVIAAPEDVVGHAAPR